MNFQKAFENLLNGNAIKRKIWEEQIIQRNSATKDLLGLKKEDVRALDWVCMREGIWVDSVEDAFPDLCPRCKKTGADRGNLCPSCWDEVTRKV